MLTVDERSCGLRCDIAVRTVSGVRTFLGKHGDSIYFKMGAVHRLMASADVMHAKIGSGTGQYEKTRCCDSPCSCS